MGTDAEGNPTVRPQAPAEISCESLQPPADPESRYNAYRGQGSAIQLMETYAEEDEAAGVAPTALPQPDLRTHVAVHTMTQHDAHALQPALADVSRRHLCPSRLLGDSHYGSTENVEQLHTAGITLLAPAMPPKGAKQGQLTLEHFVLDEIGRVTACPQGHASVWTSVSDTRLAVRFDPAPCQACSSKEQCPGAAATQTQHDSRWQSTPERVAQRQRRLAEQEAAFQAHYRWRAGIAATMSRLKHHMHLARLRIRGMGAMQYPVALRALGLNIVRVAACL